MPGETELKPGERIDLLVSKQLRIIQNPAAFCFSIDAVLLAHFAWVKPGDLVCDLGTGTGVIPLLLSAISRADHIYGLEIQPEMADMARRSVLLNGLDDKITIETGDLREAVLRYGSSRFDLVATNPPYHRLRRGELNQTDAQTLARHEVLCTLEDVVTAGSQIVKSRGRFALVHRPERLTDILLAMRQRQLEPKRLQLVHPRAGEPASILLVEAVKDGRPGLSVLPPLCVYEADGTYTAALRDIYFGKHEGGCEDD